MTNLNHRHNALRVLNVLQRPQQQHTQFPPLGQQQLVHEQTLSTQIWQQQQVLQQLMQQQELQERFAHLPKPTQFISDDQLESVPGSSRFNVDSTVVKISNGMKRQKLSNPFDDIPIIVLPDDEIPCPAVGSSEKTSEIMITDSMDALLTPTVDNELAQTIDERSKRTSTE